ncbi:MAG: nucleotidyltransferase [Selenomonadaceae bacterium]|nr:nucleotidyltransferase [Selenomonadaceae bacterium]
MSTVQEKLTEFNNVIRLDYYVNEELREKRDIIIRILKNSDKVPGFTPFNQGSYAMNTGVKPIDKEYDIDIGIVFSGSKEKYDPWELKHIVQEVLANHTDYGAEIKRPCVTVTYKKNGERAYHVDLAIYAHDEDESNDQLYLAVGKTKGADDVGWEKSDPKGLITYIGDMENKDERDQFRRITRYIKRWKNLNFSPDGHSEPPSIGVTLLLHDYFQYTYDDDLRSMYSTINIILQQFILSSVADDGRLLYRLKCSLPSHLQFECDTDVFKKMTDLRMTTFKDKLEKLKNKLNDALVEEEPVKQCQILGEIYGDDFPLIEPTDLYQEHKSFVPYSSSSGM